MGGTLWSDLLWWVPAFGAGVAFAGYLSGRFDKRLELARKDLADCQARLDRAREESKELTLEVERLYRTLRTDIRMRR